MRAAQPAVEGLLDRDGTKVGYAVWGDGPVTLVLAPAWLVVDARMWKAQVPYLSRYFRVVTVEPRGNGSSDRSRDPADYRDVDLADDLVAVLDAVGVRRAVLAGASLGGWRSLVAAARHPDRVDGVIAVSPTIRGLLDPAPGSSTPDWEAELAEYEGWAKYNKHYWRADYRGFLEFFFGTVISEPHSTKQLEDCVGWGLGSDAEVLIAAEQRRYLEGREALEEMLAGVRCPVLVIHGDDDRLRPIANGRRVAELTGGRMIEVGGGGHILPARHPVAVNRWMRDFVTSVNPPAPRTSRWTRTLDRPRRVLYLSSPIGLGHARRDLAIARELRARHPEIRIDWLAQHPVTELLTRHGEHVHPASALLASESAHWESESDEHDLHAFQAVRRMDEILVANFMTFADLVEGEHYDLWVGDESWEVDFFLHENPELKRSPYAWLTDFVGWLPMPDGGPAEAALTADYNAEMIEHIARLPKLRDAALFVGDPQDVVPDSFGAALPGIRDWTTAHYRFTGYVTGFDPAEIADRAALRAAYGWADDERICLVTVGGTGVGEHLLRRAVAAFPHAAALVAGLRMVIVTGPRIDPASIPAAPGLEVHPYLPDLYRHLAACDLAVVQGGLTTTMELVAAGRPFLYIPLRHHFEQQFHVPHRLDRYGAGRRLDYEQTTPEPFARAIADEIGRAVSYRPVATDGAARAAAYLSELL